MNRALRHSALLAISASIGLVAVNASAQEAPPSQPVAPVAAPPSAPAPQAVPAAEPDADPEVPNVDDSEAVEAPAAAAPAMPAAVPAPVVVSASSGVVNMSGQAGLRIHVVVYGPNGAIQPFVANNTQPTVTYASQPNVPARVIYQTPIQPAPMMAPPAPVVVYQQPPQPAPVYVTQPSGPAQFVVSSWEPPHGRWHRRHGFRRGWRNW